MSRTGRAPAPLRHAPHLLLAALALGAVCALLVRPTPAACLAGVSVLGSASAVAVRRGVPAAALALLAATLAVAGWAWGGARLAATAPPVLDLPAEVVGTVDVDSAPRARHGGARARVVARDLRGAGGRRIPRGTRLTADVPPGASGLVAPGVRLRVAARAVAAATERSPAWWRAHLARSRIAARLVVRTATRVGRRGGLVGLRDRLRDAASEAAGRGLSGERLLIVRGLALGGGEGLSPHTAEAFRDAGLWHLLAVSGQNIAIVAVAVLAALRAFGMRRRPAVALAGVVLVAYCLSCEGGASVARAGIVGGLALAGELRSSSRERWHLLLAGLAVLILHQPRAIGDPGLQLSFAAVAGIFVVSPPLATWLAGVLPTRVADLAAQAGGATLATAPVVVWHFGELSIAGLVVNVVAVPLAAPIVVLALCGIAATAVLPAAAVVCAWLAGAGAAALIVIAKLAAAVPGATATLPAWAAPALVLPAAGIPVLARRLWRADGPVVARPISRAAVVAALAATFAGLAAALPQAAPPERWPSGAAVTALDIGQGDAILLRSPDGSVPSSTRARPVSPPRCCARSGASASAGWTRSPSRTTSSTTRAPRRRSSLSSRSRRCSRRSPCPPSRRRRVDAAATSGASRPATSSRRATGAWRCCGRWPAPRRPRTRTTRASWSAPAPRGSTSS